MSMGVSFSLTYSALLGFNLVIDVVGTKKSGATPRSVL